MHILSGIEIFPAWRTATTVTSLAYRVSLSTPLRWFSGGRIRSRLAAGKIASPWAACASSNEVASEEEKEGRQRLHLADVINQRSDWT